MKKHLTIFLSLVIFHGSYSSSKDNWTPKEIIQTEFLGNAAFSANEDMVVWSKRIPLKEKDKFVSKLFITRLDVKKDGKFKTLQLTRGEENDHNPLFSKEGDKIYFLSSREKSKVLWALDLHGGEAEEVHKFENGISNIQWKNDSILFFLSKEGKTLYEIKYEKDDSKIIEDEEHWIPKRLFSFNVKTKKVTRITENNFPISAYKMSHIGDQLITAHTMSLHYASDGKPKPEYYITNLSTGEKRQILQDYQTPSNFQFVHDDGGFYFSSVISSDPEWKGAGIFVLHYYDISSGTITDVELDWELGLSGGSYLVVKDGIIASLANKALRKLAYYNKSGARWKMNPIEWDDKGNHISVLSVSEKGNKLVLDYSTAQKLPEYYIADLTYSNKSVIIERSEILVTLNKNLKKKKIAKSEVITWKGANDESITGILYYPTEYEKGQKYPLIISIHGGPAGTDMDSWSERWSTYPQLYCQKGAFVLKPNYHGSSNHGQKFVESIKGHYYELEEVDILNGIEFLNEKGWIDKSKMGCMGWSAGAIITTHLTIKYPDLFLAAAPGAGDVNWTSDYGTCRFGVTFDQSYFGGAPWDDVNGKFYNPNYIEKSPLFELEKVKTPTIIFHGSEDRAVPRDQGWEYYRALQQIDKAPVKFIWFPGQPHGLGKITHQLRKMNEEIAWFDKYLFKTEKEKNEAFKEESPLAMMIRLDSVSAHNGLYGIWENDILIPEMSMISKDSISIGMFEITNAQYASFDRNYEFDQNSTNHPVSGIDKEKVVSYIHWLNEKTSKKFRLPSKKEGEALHKKAVKCAKKENVFNYWAGYDITLDEAGKLQEKLSKLDKSLIKEVGSFKGQKIEEAKVFDIGGNVAEWYLDGDQLKIYGYSAYDFVDEANTENKDSQAVGFRLVLD